MSTSSASDLKLEATDWLSRRDEGFSPEEAAAFTDWLAVPEHAVVFRRLEGVWLAANAARHEGSAEEFRRQIEGNRSRRRHRQLAAWGGLAAAAALAILLFQPVVFPEAEAPTATVAAKPNQRVLADGSIVQLNAGAQIEVAYSAKTRTVRLLTGEALFKVTKDPARPFIVDAGSLSVRAVGTAFNVRRGEHEVQLIVTEGRVAVERTAVEAAGEPVKTDEPVYVSAGTQITVPVASVTLPAPQPASTEDLALEWRQRRLEFTATPLREAVRYFNHGKRQLVLADDEVGRLEISGVFWIDDPEDFARSLETSLGLTARAGGGETILLAKGR